MPECPRKGGYVRASDVPARARSPARAIRGRRQCRTPAHSAARALGERAGAAARPLRCARELPLVFAVPQSDDQIVLTDYMDVTRPRGNLARIRNDGTEVWRVTPATYSQDAWTVARLEGDVCRASTWLGWGVTLDLATGRERSRSSRNSALMSPASGTRGCRS
jgi:hypothetical protein